MFEDMPLPSFLCNKIKLQYKYSHSLEVNCTLIAIKQVESTGSIILLEIAKKVNRIKLLGHF